MPKVFSQVLTYLPIMELESTSALMDARQVTEQAIEKQSEEQWTLTE